MKIRPAAEMSAKEGMDLLKKAMREDMDYAWSWHCNIACVVMDEGVGHSAANRAASRFMQNVFGVLTREP